MWFTISISSSPQSSGWLTRNQLPWNKVAVNLCHSNFVKFPKNLTSTFHFPRSTPKINTTFLNVKQTKNISPTQPKNDLKRINIINLPPSGPQFLSIPNRFDINHASGSTLYATGHTLKGPMEKPWSNSTMTSGNVGFNSRLFELKPQVETAYS